MKTNIVHLANFMTKGVAGMPWTAAEIAMASSSYFGSMARISLIDTCLPQDRGEVAQAGDCVAVRLPQALLPIHTLESEKAQQLISEADIVCLHHRIDIPLPVEQCLRLVVFLHGNPEYSWSQVPQLNKLPEATSFVTLWQEHLEQWRALLPNRMVTAVPLVVRQAQTDFYTLRLPTRPLATAYYDPDSRHPAQLNWANKQVPPKVVLVYDTWRAGKNLEVLAAAIDKLAQRKDMLVIVVGSEQAEGDLSGALVRLRGAVTRGEGRVVLEPLQPQRAKLYQWSCGADVVLTAAKEATRVLRERMAAGATVISVGADETEVVFWYRDNAPSRGSAGMAVADVLASGGPVHLRPYTVAGEGALFAEQLCTVYRRILEMTRARACARDSVLGIPYQASKDPTAQAQRRTVVNYTPGTKTAVAEDSTAEYPAQDAAKASELRQKAVQQLRTRRGASAVKPAPAATPAAAPPPTRTLMPVARMPVNSEQSESTYRPAPKHARVQILIPSADLLAAGVADRLSRLQAAVASVSLPDAEYEPVLAADRRIYQAFRDAGATVTTVPVPVGFSAAGFSHQANALLTQALANTSDPSRSWVLLLNDDVAFLDSSFLPIVPRLLKGAQALDLAAICPLTVGHKDIGAANLRKLLKGASPLDRVLPDGMCVPKLWLAEHIHQYQDKVLVSDSMIPFTAVLLRLDAVVETGLLDSVRLPHYGSDDDYCRRLRRNGYKIGVALDAVVYHNSHGSTGEKAASLKAEARAALVEKWPERAT